LVLKKEFGIQNVRLLNIGHFVFKFNKMRGLFFIILTILTFALQAVQPKATSKFYKELTKFYGIENVKTFPIKDLSNDKDLFLKLYDGKNEIGLVVLTSAKGRHDKFDYFIIYNSSLDIQLIKILIYRSNYGSEITAKRWLSQFYEKKADSLKYGSDIQAISGATFSAIALTKNVNRINKILQEYSDN